MPRFTEFMKKTAATSSIVLLSLKALSSRYNVEEIVLTAYCQVVNLISKMYTIWKTRSETDSDIAGIEHLTNRFCKQLIAQDNELLMPLWIGRLHSYFSDAFAASLPSTHAILLD